MAILERSEQILRPTKLTGRSLKIIASSSRRCWCSPRELYIDHAPSFKESQSPSRPLACPIPILLGYAANETTASRCWWGGASADADLDFASLFQYPGILDRHSEAGHDFLVRPMALMSTSYSED